MHQDDVSVLRLLGNGLDNPLHILVLPVLGVHRPADNGRLGPLLQGLIHKAVGRPEHQLLRAHHRLDGLLGFAQLGRNLLPGHPLQGHMVPGVQANLMALIRHPADGVLVVGHLLSHQEKGGLDPPLGQAVQQGLRGLGPGAVVKGQGQISLGRQSRRRLSGRQGRHVRQRDKPRGHRQTKGQSPGAPQNTPPFFPFHRIPLFPTVAYPKDTLAWGKLPRNFLTKRGARRRAHGKSFQYSL